MKIYFFELDPQSKIYKAGIIHNGKREIHCIFNSGAAEYITTGSKITNDHKVHFFSETQTRAFIDFIGSGKFNVEFQRGI